VELDNLKAEWTAKLNDQIARHKQEIAAEKERTYQVIKVLWMLKDFKPSKLLQISKYLTV